MKKIFKIFAVLVSILLLLFLMLAVFGEKMAVSYLAPPEEFSATNILAPLDYADLESWASHPDKRDTADILTQGETAVPNNLRDVDVFYIHPTTYLGPGEWNALAGPDNAAGQGLEPVLAVHGTIFRDCCRTYIPNYRQAHIASFTKYDTQEPFMALDLAYTDVERAFEYFLEHYNGDRPFIIAGHSQGSLHAVRLIETKIQGTSLAERMIAAYPIGYWIPENKLERGLGETGLCKTGTDTHCFVTFDTYGEPGGGRNPDAKLPWWYQSGWEWVQPDSTLCTNPLTWTQTDARISADKHKGAVTNAPAFSIPALLMNKHSGIKFEELPDHNPNLTWAECKADGSLMVADQSDGPFGDLINTKSHMYHSYDWSIFYTNIKDNIETRIASYRGAAPVDVEPDPAVTHANKNGDPDHPYTENYFEFEGHTLHYVEAGEGPLIIFYHGYPTNWYSWYDQMEALKASYRVVAVDALGTGLSDAPQDIEPYTLESLSAHLNVLSKHLNGDEKFVLVGHDWGGALSWSFAQKYPERLHKVIGMSVPATNLFLELLAGNETQQKVSMYTQRTHTIDLDEIRKTKLWEFTWKNSYRSLIAKNWITDEENLIFKSALPNAERQNAALNWYRANIPLYDNITDESFWPARDAKVIVPALLVWGDEDRIFVPEFIDMMPDYATDLTIKRIPGVNHWTSMENPDEATRIIKDFLNTK